MKTITKTGYMIGCIICLLSTIRWWIMYYDPSQFAMGFIIGVIICGFAYIYEWMCLKDEYIENLTKRFDSYIYKNEQRS